MCMVKFLGILMNKEKSLQGRMSVACAKKNAPAPFTIQANGQSPPRFGKKDVQVKNGINSPIFGVKI